VSVSPQDVERIARLAGLDVDRETLTTLTQQIGRILEYVSRLEAVPGGAEMPDLLHRPPLRLDEVRAADLAAPPGSNAPAFRDGLFLVPRLLGVGGDAGPESEA